MATRHAPSISQYSFAFPPPSPLPDSPTTPLDLEGTPEDDPFEDADSVTPHSRWGSDGTFGGARSTGRPSREHTERQGEWREFVEDDEGDELDLGQGRDRDEGPHLPAGASSTSKLDQKDHKMNSTAAHEHRDDSDHDSTILSELPSSRTRPHPSNVTVNSSSGRQLPLVSDQRTVVSDRTYASSIASSSSGWVMPAPEAERSDERSMLDLDDGSDEDETEGEDSDAREERIRLALEDEEEERQEREWLAWRAGGERKGAQGWNRDKGSKLDRMLGEGAPLPLSAYSDVVSGPGTLAHTDSSTSTATIKPPPTARSRPPGQGHVFRGSIESGQSYLSLDGSDDEIASQHSASPFYFADHTQAQQQSRHYQPTSSSSAYQTSSSRRDPVQPPYPTANRDRAPLAPLRNESDRHPPKNLSMSSLTPEEKARLLRRAKKLEARLGVTLTGDLIAGSLTRPAPVARGPGGRRASDPERILYADAQRFSQSAVRLGPTREDQSVLRSRGKTSGGDGFSALGFGGSSMVKSSSSPGATSYAGDAYSTTSAFRPRIVQRSSLPASPAASEFRMSLGLDSPTSPAFDQSYPAHSSIDYAPRTAIPRHHLDRLVQNSSTLSLPASLRTNDEDVDSMFPTDENRTPRRPSTAASNSPVSEYGFPQPSPSMGKFDARGLLDEDLAIRRLRMIRLSKIHHVLGGEVPQEQLVDGPGTGPWLEPASYAPHSRSSSNRSEGTDSSDGWKGRIGRVRDKVERSTSEMKGMVGAPKTEKEKKVKGKGKSGDEGAREGEQTSFLSLEAGDLPDVGGGAKSKRGLKLNKLFGDAPAPNLYHQAKQPKAASPTASFFSTRDSYPSSSSTSTNRLSNCNNKNTHQSSTEVLDFLRD